MRDPLSFFLHEKVAVAEAPTTARPVTRNPDPRSPDSGERAIAGLTAVGSSLAAKFLPAVGSFLLNGMFSEKDDVPWHNAVPASGAKNIADLMEEVHPPKSKLMGLFDLSARTRPFRTAEEADKFAVGVKKLKEVENVVDSFIDKHHLIERGVRLNFQRGALNSAMGSRYHIPSKTVFFPSQGKETLLHELGHAADFTGSTLGKIRGAVGPGLNRAVSIALPIAMIAGDRIKEVLPGTIDDKAISFMQDHAPLIMGATLAATSLYPEAKASFTAIRHIATTEGPVAARAAFRKLAPSWAGYLLSAIPPIVGMALARKYMRNARAESDQEKISGPIFETARTLGRELKHGIADTALDLAHAGREIGRQTVSMIQQPGLMSRLGHAAKEVGTSPEFVQGALSAALPATMAALYMYGTPAGKHIRDRIHPEHNQIGDYPLARRTHDTWREKHPLRFAGLVAAGASLSAGILAKFYSDLQRVM